MSTFTPLYVPTPPPNDVTINARGGLSAQARNFATGSAAVWLSRAGQAAHNGNVTVMFDTMAEAEAFAAAINAIWPAEDAEGFVKLGAVAAVVASDALANTPEAMRLVPRHAALHGSVTRIPVAVKSAGAMGVVSPRSDGPEAA